MAAKILDGRKISDEVRQEVAKEVEELKRRGVTPGLAAILIGNNPASVTYVRAKEKACHEVGIAAKIIRLEGTVSQADVLGILARLSEDPSVHGILVQLPLPKQLSERAITNALPPEKDVDGLHPLNRGRLLAGEDTFIPCTPAGIHEMLLRSGHSPEGKHTVILGRSAIVGTPLANLLLMKRKGANSTVTVCHTGTPNLRDFTRRADILVAAMGRPELVTGDMVRPGAVVIDVGVNRVADPTSEKGYRIVGDVDFASVSHVAEAISPVPGGVGPMTVVMLLKNVVKAARLQTSRASSSTG